MSTPGSNGFDAVKPHVEAFEAVDAELEAMKMDYMNRCRDKREAQKRIVKMVKAEGFAADSFKAVLKHRRLERKIEEIATDLDDADAVESYQFMLEALGGLADLPLGQAALSQPRDRHAERAAAVDSLASDDADDAESKQVSDNVTALRRGIAPLN